MGSILGGNIIKSMFLLTLPGVTSMSIVIIGVEGYRDNFILQDHNDSLVDRSVILNIYQEFRVTIDPLLYVLLE